MNGGIKFLHCNIFPAFFFVTFYCSAHARMANNTEKILTMLLSFIQAELETAAESVAERITTTDSSGLHWCWNGTKKQDNS